MNQRDLQENDVMAHGLGGANDVAPGDGVAQLDAKLALALAEASRGRRPWSHSPAWSLYFTRWRIGRIPTRTDRAAQKAGG